MLGGADLFVAVLILIAIWVGLPARWWVVDVFGTLLAIMYGVTGGALARGLPWAERAGKIAGAVGLGIGLLLVTTLAITASHLSGLYGPVGAGGAVLLLTIALLIVPYLVLLPAAQLWVLTR
jgi:hypothetical protein